MENGEFKYFIRFFDICYSKLNCDYKFYILFNKNHVYKKNKPQNFILGRVDTVDCYTEKYCTFIYVCFFSSNILNVF